MSHWWCSLEGIKDMLVKRSQTRKAEGQEVKEVIDAGDSFE